MTDKPLLVCPTHGEVPWDEVRHNPATGEPYHFYPSTPVGRVVCGKDLGSRCTCDWKNAHERSVVDGCCQVHGHSEIVG